MSNFSLNKSIFEETYKEDIQLQTDLSSLQFQYLNQENINLSTLDNSEVLEISESNLLENEIWTEEEISKFKILYQKTKDILEKQDNDNQKLDDDIMDELQKNQLLEIENIEEVVKESENENENEIIIVEESEESEIEN